jgi:predicted nucleic acid-binding Zn ribbon protein
MSQAAVVYVSLMLTLFPFCRLGEELTQQVSSFTPSYQYSCTTPTNIIIILDTIHSVPPTVLTCDCCSAQRLTRCPLLWRHAVMADGLYLAVSMEILLAKCRESQMSFTRYNYLLPWKELGKHIQTTDVTRKKTGKRKTLVGKNISRTPHPPFQVTRQNIFRL